MTVAWLGVLTFSLCKTKVYKNTALCRGVVEEVRGFDISMYDMVSVNSGQGGKEGAEIGSHVGDGHVPEIVSEVMVAEVGENGDDLIGTSEGGDQGAHGGAVAQVMKQLELVEDSRRGRGDVDLFDGDKA